MSLPWALLCVCCVRTAPAAPRKGCPDRGRADPSTRGTQLGCTEQAPQTEGEKPWNSCVWVKSAWYFCFQRHRSAMFFLIYSSVQGQNHKDKQDLPNSRPGLRADQSCSLWLRLKAALKWKSIHNLGTAVQAAPARAFAFQLFNKRQSHSRRFVSLYPSLHQGVLKRKFWGCTKSLFCRNTFKEHFFWNLPD